MLFDLGAPSSGAIALGEILGVLQNQDMKALGSENIHSWRWIGDASRIAFADRDYYVGDPAFVNVPTRALISQAYLKPRAKEIRQSDKALENIHLVSHRIIHNADVPFNDCKLLQRRLQATLHELAVRVVGQLALTQTMARTARTIMSMTKTTTVATMPPILPISSVAI